ncbi:MAG TPA: hypothetical protein VGM44_03465 [Polyangiaceae bacterium]
MAPLDRNSSVSDDDYNPHGEHVVEIPARHLDAETPHKRSYATLGVAVFIGTAGVMILAGLALDHSVRETVDSSRQNELRDGWQTLSAIAAEGAEADQMAAAAAAASARAAPTPVEVLPVVQSPAATVVVVPVPGASANQSTNQAPAAATTNAAPTPTTVPVPVPALPNAAIAPQSFPNAAVVTPNGTPAAPVALPTPNAASASVPATNPVTPIPNGTVPASPPIQSVPTGAVPPAPFPASQQCGITTCNLGSVCCNPSCGICTAPGAACPLRPCR